ncbi:MAG: PAT family beta-lactamase induction signal transducer AmpG [Gammaproteobacteria bacterium]|jgi:PAT family beta-lactamase induction signal transducer AmpG
MNSWQSSIRAFSHPRVITMLFFGFSAGVPLLLIFSSLGLWLREAGVDRSTATLFSWAALGYSFKFVWAPLADCLPIPYLTRLLGKRRSWILLSQLAIMSSIILMSLSDPSSGTTQLKFMALAAVLLGFSSATQDIVIDAYRIESASSELQALMASTYVAGYRLGMIAAGAGSLFIASYFGSEMGSYSYSAWQKTYIIMSLIMLAGVITTFVISEPDHCLAKERKYKNETYIRLLLVFIFSVTSFVLLFHLSSDIAASCKNYLSDLFKNHVLGSFIVETIRLAIGVITALTVSFFCIKLKIIEEKVIFESYAEPIIDFFKRHGFNLALILLVLIGLYRISDIVLGVIANIFYQDLGYSKNEIASIVKTFGLIMTIIGGFLGGILAMRFGVMKILFIGALLTVVTNLLFMLLAINGYNIPLLYLVISADNLSAGIASAAFIAFLSRLTNVSFTAMQYALFSSLMTLIPKTLGGYSGSIVDNIGYTQFFFVASMLGIPILGIIWLANKHLKIE